MNLFLLGLNISAVHFTNASKIGKALKVIYPDDKLCERMIYRSADLKNFIVAFNSISGSAKKNYISENDDYILLYSGLPIDPAKRISAFRAEEFLENFEAVKYEYEGQACIIRLNKRTNDAEVLTDIMGIEQVYCYNQNEECIISNSISLIEIVTNCHQPDLCGAGYFLSIGWPAGNSTLRKDIKLIEGGEHWKWNRCKSAVEKKVYYKSFEIKPSSREILNRNAIKDLHERLSNYFLILNEHFELECPLTGGYDSRLVTALLLNKNIEAKYYTTGNPGHPDVSIASLIARRFNLAYTNYQIEYEKLFDNWDVLVRKLILQNDGLVSLWQIFDLLSHQGEVISGNIRLATIGSEAARVTYNDPILYQNDLRETDIYDYLKRRLFRPDELLTENTGAIFNSYYDRFFCSFLEKGINFKFLPDLFYLKERVGRFHANNWRINRNISDMFSVFCTRPYLNAALKLHPLDKSAYPIHYRMMKMVNKDIFSLPLIHGKWPMQKPRTRIFLNKNKELVKKYYSRIRKDNGIKNLRSGGEVTVNIFDKRGIFKEKLNEIKSVCLDQSGSELWQLINKEKLEYILSDESRIDDPLLPLLYIIATLFYYEHYTSVYL